MQPGSAVGPSCVKAGEVGPRLGKGLSRRLGLGVGTWAVIVGGLVLLLWIPLRQRPGLGTLSNVIMIGLVIDLVLAIVPPEPDESLVKLQRVQAYVGLARNISLALAVVLVVLIGALLLLRSRRVPTPAPAAGPPKRNWRARRGTGPARP